MRALRYQIAAKKVRLCAKYNSWVAELGAENDSYLQRTR